MGKEGGRRFVVVQVVELVKRSLGRVNPLGSSARGPELTEDERLASLPYTKKGDEAMSGNEGKPPFDYKWKNKDGGDSNG